MIPTTTDSNTNNITEIAIYIRKSRGDEEDVLDKHKKLLIDYADHNRLKYVLYAEVASGDSIAYRPKMRDLLRDMRKNLFDAVLVVDYDRLCRGDKEDQAIIEKTFMETKTYILTPTKAYDLNNESDAMLTDVQSFFARMEYRQTKLRFNRGKHIGATMGHWTNGPAPFPYVYNPSKKTIVVDEAKRFLYQEIKTRAITGESLASIRFDLNRRGYRTNKGKLWSENALYRILTNQTHLGHVVRGKTTGSGHKNKKSQPLTINSHEDWTIAVNAHEAVISEEEVVQIREVLHSNRIIPKKARKGIYPLSGLLRCGKCGYAINFTNNSKSGKIYYFLKKCNKPDPFGVRCCNPGVRMELILEIIKLKLAEYEIDLTKRNEDISISQNERLKSELLLKENERKKHEAALDKIREMYEEQEYTREEYQGRKEKRLKELSLIKTELENIKNAIQINEQITIEDRLDHVYTLKKLWGTMYTGDNGLMDEDGAKKINLALRKVIDKIVYVRADDDINLEITFL